MSKNNGLSDTDILERLVTDPTLDQKRGNTLPGKLLFALRMATESGMTCEEISSIIVLSAGLREIRDRMGPQEVNLRSVGILNTIKEDIQRLEGNFPPVSFD